MRNFGERAPSELRRILLLGRWVNKAVLERLRVALEGHPAVVEALQEGDGLPYPLPAEAVQRPEEQHVEPVPRGVGEHPVEVRALPPAPRPGLPVDVLGDELVAIPPLAKIPERLRAFAARWQTAVHPGHPRSSYECNDPNEEGPCDTWTSRSR